MENHTATVRYSQSKNCLVGLPAGLSSILNTAGVRSQEVVVEISQKGKKLYVNWDGFSLAVAGTVLIDSTFARALGFNEGDSVLLSMKLKIPTTSRVSLDPLTVADWELVQLHADVIEDRFINQARCASVGQVLVVYPTLTSLIKFTVTDIGIPGKFALISPYAEMAIAPKEAKKVAAATPTKPAKLEYVDLPAVLQRGISLPHALFDVQDKKQYIVYANESEINFTSDYVAVSILTNDKAKQPERSEGKEIKETKRVIARLVNHPCPSKTVGLSRNLAIALKVENMIGSVVTLKPAIKNSKRPVALTIHPYITQTRGKQITINSAEKKEQLTKLTADLTNYLYSKDSLALSCLTNFTKIPAIPQLLPQGGLIRFKRNDDSSSWIKPYGEKKNIKLEIGEELLRTESFIEERRIVDPELGAAIGMKATVDDIVDSFITSKNTGTLVYGNSGSGKTLLLKLVSERMAEFGHHTKYISCESLMNDTFLQAKTHITKWIQACAWHKPALLVLDNLDKILTAEMDNVDSSKSNQLTEFLVTQLEKVHNQNHSNVSVLLSSNSKESLNKLLTQCHLIENFNHLSAPDKMARLELLEKYLTIQLDCDVKFDIMDMVAETEGYLPNDMKVLCDRLYHEALFEASEKIGKTVVHKRHLIKSLDGFTPSNLRGAKLQKSSVEWSDIGGLVDAKNILLETLEWPTKYAPIFANCPLRLRSGILLYGYPGCGKTLLASAVAGQCGLNFISIKGPEILNKYIGASEQSVRELFERAQAAKPCILFFDEFDSIAPKRGHDSTGVTDRVVNQMLTQMDGAEGLDGVYVLAATSRPDLIDSALLRPGRLDKSVICDMPSYEDRLDILRSITLKMDLEADVNLEEIAEETVGFSGADMQGLGYNAYLKAVHIKLAAEEVKMGSSTPSEKHKEAVEFIRFGKTAMRPAERIKIAHEIQQILGNSDTPEEKRATRDTTVYISRADFAASLNETKPSISVSEKRKLEKVYSQFVSARDGNMPDGAPSSEIGGRTTLM